MNIKSTFAYMAYASVLLATPALSADEIKTDEQKISYAIGFQIGSSLKQQGLSNLDIKIVSQAIDDVLQNRELKLSMEEMQAAFQAKQKEMMAERQAEGEKFLAENKKKAGIKTLDNGIQYKVLAQGKGKKPTLASSVVAHYRGTLINGKEFDSSYKRGEPATFPLNGVIKGWQEVLPMMAEGSKWQVWIPSDLAYGSNGAGGDIGPNETLIFEIELIEVKS